MTNFLKSFNICALSPSGKEKKLISVPLTHNEAREYLRTGYLPDDFDERVETALEVGVCFNCGNVKNMNIVRRSFDEEKSDWCPDCVEGTDNPLDELFKEKTSRENF